MKPKYAFALAVAIGITLFLIFTGYTSILNSKSSGASIVKTNTHISAFTTQTIDNKNYTPTKTHNVVVYEVFASWCLPCRISVPAAKKFAKSNPNVSVVGVAYRDVIPEIQKFENKYGSFSTTIKTDGQIEDALGVRSIPQTLFVVDGSIKYRIYGSASETDLNNVLSLVKREFTSSK